MSRLAAWIGRSRNALIAIAIACATAAAAQPGLEPTPPEAPRTDEARFDPAAIEARLTGIKLALDRIAGSLQRDGLPVQILFDLAQSIGPLREQLDAAIAELDPRLGQLDAALKQVGPPPAAGAPPESATITAERARLQAEYSTIDAVLKQTRLLATRADELSEQISQRRRALYARQLLEQSPSIETFERASVIIPNAEFITGAVKNWTHANTTGRIIVKVGVGYDSDPDRVREILLACADEHSRVMKMPAPRALLLAFGDNALEFELRAYVDNVEVGLGTRSDLHLAILRRFRAAGIVIPYPQREVRLLCDAPALEEGA